MKRKTFSTTVPMQISPCAQAGRSAGLNLGVTTARQALAILRKNQLSIECEPKRLGGLASPASAFAFEREVGSRGFGLSRYAQSVCQ